MAIAFPCSHCSHSLRVPDDVAGKRIKCPKCQQILRIPGPSEEQTGTEPLLQLKTPDGHVYGPVPREEMDRWMHEGRITDRCELLDEQGNHRQWASECYPQLSSVNPPPPTSSDAGSPTAPVTVYPVASSFMPPTSPLPKTSWHTDDTQLRQVHSDSEAVVPRFRPRSYPALNLTSRFYRALGWVLVFVGGIAAFFFSVIYVGGMILSTDEGQSELLVPLALGFAALVGGAIYLAAMVITLWAAAEAIKCLLDIQDNSHRCSFYLQNFQKREQEDTP
jgi:phage FluMu protein Com